MPVNSDKPHLWKADVAASVDLYNNWFLKFGPKAYRETRLQTTGRVQEAESKRRAVQATLDNLRSQAERNAIGQYATPFALAVEIVEFARDNRLLPDAAIRFLDPAAGTGAFFSALRHTLPQPRIASALGIEIDPQVAAAAKEIWSQWGLDVQKADFTRLPFPAAPGINFLAANPPYVRHHHLDRAEKLRLRERVEDAVGLKLSGLSGLYGYFLLLAHRWLAEEGFAAWLVPSEFMDVNYGSVIKRYLAEQVTLHHVHRFHIEDVQFDDALVSSTVLFFQKRAPAPQHEVVFSSGGTLKQPRISARVLQPQLADVGKWTSLPEKPVEYFIHTAGRSKTARIGDVFDIRRGIATGANEFFILRREAAREKGLPAQFLRPILPSPRYLTQDIIRADEEGYPEVEPSLVLLDCSFSEREAKRFPALQAYLVEGKSQGIVERYIPRHRTPWYKQEERPPAPILCSYMSRGGPGTSGLRFFRNYSQATAPNVYLMLYPAPEWQAIIRDEPDVLDALFELLKRASHEHLLHEGRSYGGGLNKIEPKELARVPLPADALLERIGVRPRQLILLER